MNSTEAIIEAKGLRKEFSLGGEVLEVIRDVSFSLSPATSLSIRGESGCGKTTLLNLLARIESADAGEVRWAGNLFPAQYKPGKKEISMRGSFLGVVYQAYYLIPELNVLENVLLPSRMVGDYSSVNNDRARHLLEQMGVLSKEMQIPGKLSGGERQRVAIARALLNQPKVILADEPTGNLDERTGAEVMDLLLRTCEVEKTALILVTHNTAFAQSTNRQAYLTEGTLQDE